MPRSDKRKRYTHSRKTVKYQGMSVVLPRGAKKMTAQLARRLDNFFPSAGPWNSGARKGCRVIFFKAGEPVMRCPGRKLKGHNKTQCRAKARKGSSNYKRFVKCR